MEKNTGKISLSHSGLDILYRCPRCFWLKYNKGINQPEGITSRLPDRFDKVIKDYFNKFRSEGKVPPIIEGKIKGWLENPFQEKYYYSINEKYDFLGKLDECLVNSNGLYVPVDFKTTSSDPRENLKAFPSYQNQLDEFTFLLEVNGKKTARLGYLVYFYPEKSDKLHNGFPMFVHIEPLITNFESVKPRLLEAIRVLEEIIPEPANNCPFCKWYDALSETLKENLK